MLEQSTQTNNYERLKKKAGRPKGTCLFTGERKTSKNETKATLFFKHGKRKGKHTIIISSNRYCFKLCFLKKQVFIFQFPFKPLAN